MVALFTVALWVVVLGIIAFPLMAKHLEPHLSQLRSDSLQHEKNAVLSTIQELQEDFQLARISEEDYQQLKQSFQNQYLKLIQQEELLHGSRTS